MGYYPKVGVGACARDAVGGRGLEYRMILFGLQVSPCGSKSSGDVWCGRHTSIKRLHLFILVAVSLSRSGDGPLVCCVNNTGGCGGWVLRRARVCTSAAFRYRLVEKRVHTTIYRVEMNTPDTPAHDRHVIASALSPHRCRLDVRLIQLSRLASTSGVEKMGEECRAMDTVGACNLGWSGALLEKEHQRP